MANQDDDDEIERFRARFPGALTGTYLNVAERGLLSDETRAAMASYLDEFALGGSSKTSSHWIGLARQRFAQLVRAHESEIALVKNVSDGINAVANAVDWKPGDNVVLCEALEHPSNRYPWYSLRDRHGVEIRMAQADDGHIEPGRVAALVDGKTRIVSVSHVTYAPGFRTDIATIGQCCRERGALMVVDAAQTVGVLDIDLGRIAVDVLAVGTSKSLLGLYGLGFLFVRKAIADDLRPAYLSGQGAGLAPAGGSNHDRLVLKPGAGRFEVGNPNHLGCVAAAASIEQLLALGTATVEHHAVHLAKDLADGLRAFDLPVFDAGSDALRSHIVSVGHRLEDALDSTSDGELNDLFHHLAAARVHASIRQGVLRFSVHAYNNRDDIGRTLEIAGDWRRAH